MDAINKGARSLNSAIDKFQSYVIENGAAIAFLVFVIYFVRKTLNNKYSDGQGYTLSQSSTTSSPSTKSAQRSRQEELILVRQRQQEIANERARQAAIERKKKEEEERQRRNMVAQKKYLAGGDKVGDANGSTESRPKHTKKHDNDSNTENPWGSGTSSSSSSGGFNHLLNQSGSSYRPARRRPMS